QQDNETIENGLSEFYNGVLAYTMAYPKNNLNISIAGNSSYNVFGVEENITLGPTLAIGKQFFDKKLRTNFSTSYNTSFNNGEKQNDVFNIRLGGNYPFLENHNVSLNLMSLFRNSVQGANNDFTATLSYSYKLSDFKINIKRKPTLNEEDDPKLATVRFKYKDITYSGPLPTVLTQLNNVWHSARFSNIPVNKNDELKILFETVKERKEPDSFKNSALNFLENLYGYEEYLPIYHNSLLFVIEKIKNDMRDVDFTLEKRVVRLKKELDDHALAKLDRNNLNQQEKELLPEYKQLEKDMTVALERLAAHRWMQPIFNEFNGMEALTKPNNLFAEFMQ